MKYYLLILLWLGAHLGAYAEPEYSSSAGSLKITTIARGLKHPWSLAFLPDDTLLVTERPGRMRIISKTGQISSPLKNVPKVYAQGQGGLLDVTLDPAFKKNRIIYFSYAEKQNDKAGTAVAKALLTNEGLQDVQVLFRQNPKAEGNNHWGSRVVVKDDSLFVTLGERYHYRDRAQDLSTHLGKVVRIHTDGTIPSDNPFVANKNALPEIWSYGHRNPQGAALHPETGQLWTAEHGPKGGDEINLTEAGKNYGWPVISYGVDYSGLPIAKGTHHPGMEQPFYKWVPSVSPSGMLFYTGSKFPKWQGDLFLGALSGMCLIRLDIENGKVIKEERLLKDLNERIRDVRQGPDGFIYLLTDSEDGRILRLEPSS